MSFASYKDLIDYGDTVILYMGYDNMLQFTVERQKVHQMKFGAVKHDDLVGVQFGSKVACARGYVYVLHPTPELWTINLPHRTQILYSTDISMIVMQLDLRPGCIVVEAGTGSASLSHAILRTIAPSGHLHTFDFHALRVKMAHDEFLAHGFNDSLVTVKLRDVCSEGFGVDVATVNAVFLDLPSPWLAIPFAAKALMPGGRICSFSPCMEQVQRACAAMSEAGFTDVITLECLQRTLDVRTIVLPVADLGYGSEKSHDAAGLQTSVNPLTIDMKPATGHIEIGHGNEQGAVVASKKAMQSQKPKSKTVKNDCENSAEEEENEGSDNAGAAAKRPWQQQREQKASYFFKSAMPPLQMNGHTGFLTFAMLYPR